MIGKTVSHYQILAKLGGGGMGVVYKAEDTRLKRIVALKFLPPDLTRDDEAKARFIHEARTASSLDHPNICTIYEIGEADDGQLFIAMAYYEGETLKKKVCDNRLPVDGVIDIAIQIAQGLAKAHEHGIIHRDIKSANVIVTNNGVVKIIDFGLAKLMGAAGITKTPARMGTISYMSPEQMQGESVDHRTDIWSLGVVLYEMLTGQLPFKGESDPPVIYSILNDEPEPMIPLALGRTALALAWEGIVSRALAKNPEERFQSMEEMSVDLPALKKIRAPDAAKQPTIKARLPQRKRTWFRRAIASALALLSGAGFYYWRDTEKKKESAPLNAHRIAVLPFINISPNAEEEYFAEGMTEELISTLSKIGSLKVISRTSVMQYKNTGKSVVVIGRELKAGTILEGSVRKADSMLRITVKLVESHSQEHLWTQNYDRPLADVFAIQSDIAQQVAEALQLRLLREEKQKLVQKGAGNLEAYTLFLRGRYFWNQRTAEGIQRGLEYFERALEVDSTCALAYAGLADAYTALGTIEYGGLAPKDIIPKAKAAALRALAIDETLVEANAALANIRFTYEWDWPNAEREFQRVLALSPSYAEAHHRYAHYLAALGRFEEALAEERQALELDPLSLIINTQLGVIFYYMRRYDEAIAQYRKTLELDSNFVQARLVLGAAYAQKGVFEEAIAELQKAFDLSGGNPMAAALLAYAYGVSGKKDEGVKILHELQQSAQQQVSPAHLVLIHLGLDQQEQALTALEQACEARSNYLVFLKVEPFADSLRAQPRFIALLKKVGLQR